MFISLLLFFLRIGQIGKDVVVEEEEEEVVVLEEVEEAVELVEVAVLLVQIETERTREMTVVGARIVDQHQGAGVEAGVINCCS